MGFVNAFKIIFLCDTDILTADQTGNFTSNFREEIRAICCLKWLSFYDQGSLFPLISESRTLSSWFSER
jgi:hypothetical protein